MISDRQIKIIGGPPEFWILSGLWQRHRMAVIGFAVLVAFAIAAFPEWMKVRPATVQFLQNDKPITDLVVSWPDENSFRFDSATATVEVIHFDEGHQQSVFVSSSVLNLGLNVRAGEHEVIRHYVSPRTGRTATITQTTRKFLGIFETTTRSESVSLADSEDGKTPAKSTPVPVLVSQIKNEALAVDQK